MKTATEGGTLEEGKFSSSAEVKVINNLVRKKEALKQSISRKRDLNEQEEAALIEAETSEPSQKKAKGVEEA